MLKPGVLMPEDLKSAIELASEIFEKDMGACFPVFLSEKNIGNLLGVKDGNRVVSLFGMQPAKISIYGYTLKVGLIGSVCTHPDYRGAGFASRMLEMMQAKSIKMGISMFIISGTRGLYKRFGAVEFGCYHTAKILPDGEKTKVQKAYSKDVGKILSIHQKKTVRYLRSYDSFKAIFKSGYIACRPGETYLGEESYCTFTSIDNELHVLEYGGNKSEVLRIIRAVTAEKNKNYCVLHYDNSFDYPADKTTTFEGTAKIISSENFFSQLEGFFLERLSEREYKEFKNKASKLDNTELTKAVFNEGMDLGLEGIFPITLPDYGWDYI
ncbi:hypothetical protein AT15_02280 [Kosmotoga arenicorallina S304]|uniref:N-acetyltransferase domain-containing protein n=1 Tax=Kosmotoga arenicorallina S304 TaxID=1453497 RepID=A0A176JZW8_9BACT|nr:GNAT family N-acetyltransferase [Kosmotoga arenicorallina]OAA29368.1 hypothetical protein AT15_02280 [Kosmotoga arenicorallina S304]